MSPNISRLKNTCNIVASKYKCLFLLSLISFNTFASGTNKVDQSSLDDSIDSSRLLSNYEQILKDAHFPVQNLNMNPYNQGLDQQGFELLAQSEEGNLQDVRPYLYDPAYHPFNTEYIKSHAQDSVMLYQPLNRYKGNRQAYFSVLDYTGMRGDDGWYTTPLEQEMNSLYQLNSKNPLFMDPIKVDIAGDGDDELAVIFYDWTTNNIALDLTANSELDETVRHVLYTPNYRPDINGKLSNSRSDSFIDAITGDANGDGIDDFLVVQFGSEVSIYTWTVSGASESSDVVFTRRITHNFASGSTNPYSKVSIATGDLTGDHKDELAVSLALAIEHYPTKIWPNDESTYPTAGKVMVFKVNNGHVSKLSQKSTKIKVERDPDTDLITRISGIMVSSIKIFDFDGDNRNEIVVAGGIINYQETFGSVSGELLLFRDWMSDHLRLNYLEANQTATSLTWGSHGAAWTKSVGKWAYAYQYYDELYVWDPFGWGKAQFAIYGGKLIQFNHDSNSTALHVPVQGERFDTNFALATGNFAYNLADDPNIPNSLEPDMVDDRSEELFGFHYSRYQKKYKYDRRYTSNGSFWVMELKQSAMEGYEVPRNILNVDDVFESRSVKSVDPGGIESYLDFSSDTYMYTRPKPIMLDFRSRGVTLKYRGVDEHYVGYSYPIVDAVLSYPPFYEESKNGHDWGGISYSDSGGSGSCLNESKGISDRHSAGISYQGNFLGLSYEYSVKGVFGIDEINAKESCVYNTASLTYTENWLGGRVSNSVLYSIVPYDVFKYDILSSRDLNSDNTIMEIRLPRRPLRVMTSFNTYNSAFTNKNSQVFKPLQESDFFQHQVGHPSSYMQFSTFEDLYHAGNTLTSSYYGALYGETQSELAIIVDSSHDNIQTTNYVKGRALSAQTGLLAIDTTHLVEEAKTISSKTSNAVTVTSSVPGLDRSLDERGEAIDDPITMPNAQWGLFAYPRALSSAEDKQVMVYDHWVTPYASIPEPEPEPEPEPLSLH